MLAILGGGHPGPGDYLHGDEMRYCTHCEKTHDQWKAIDGPEKINFCLVCNRGEKSEEMVQGRVDHGYQRTGGNGPAYAPTPVGKTVAKVDAYGWTIVDEPGVFRMIDKSVLNVDHAYQRESVNAQRVNRIAGKWSWVKFNSISVAQRSDGSYYVLDGQHRKLAADKRADINAVPCIVFKVNNTGDEASAFLAINADRGSVRIGDKFRSLVASRDPVATAVNKMVTENGYYLSNTAGVDSHLVVGCLHTLMSTMAWDSDSCRSAWAACVKVCNAKSVSITDKLIKAMFHAERHMAKNSCGSITEKKNMDRLVEAGHDQIIREIDRSIDFLRGKVKSLAKIPAEGIITILNYKRRNRIPSILAGE